MALRLFLLSGRHRGKGEKARISGALLSGKRARCVFACVLCKILIQSIKTKREKMKFLFDENDIAYNEKGRRVGRVVSLVVLDAGGVVLLPGLSAGIKSK